MAETRVLQILGPSAGGIKRHVTSLSDGLASRGWHVEVAGPPGVLAGLGHQHHDVVVPRSPAIVPAVRALGALLRNFDLVHAHGLTVGWASALVRRRPPLVLSVHNLVLSEAEGAMAPLLRRLEGSLPRRVDHTIAISDEIATRYEGRVDPGSITVVPPVGPAPCAMRSGREVRESLGLDATTPLVVLAGRLHPQKGIGTFLHALAEVVLPELREVRVMIAGQGPEHDRLVAERDRLGLEHAVRFLGDRDDVADLMGAADVVVMSSIWESFGLVVSEALQLGRPVVATAVGPVPRMVIDRRTGRLVPPSDPNALGEAILDLLGGRSTALAMGEAGRRHVLSKFGPDALVDGVEAIYRRLLDQRPGAAR